MKKRWYGSALLILMCAMLVFTSACSNNNGGNSADGGTKAPAASGNNENPDREEITIDVFSMLANYAGEQPGWFAKLVKDKFNIKLNIIASNLAGGQQKIATMMASGDLGDLVVFGTNGRDYQDAIKAGLLLDFTKDDLLNKYGQGLLANAPEAIEANKKQFGGGTAVYGVGFDVGTGEGPSEGATMNYGPNLRWDLYQQLGSPEIKTLNDYLPLLKKMQELEPKSENGRPTYGISLWSDWDGSYMTLAKVIAQFHGYNEGDGLNPAGMILTHQNKDEWQGVLDEDGYYLQGLKFYYDANQMGLLDPDSLTQKFSDVSNKIKDGQVLFSHFPWVDNVYNTPERTAEGKGFALVPFADEKVTSYGQSPYGGNRVWAIGADAKDPERIMEFLSWLYSPEGVMEANYGPKGLAWDIDGSGKPFVTEYGWKALPANAEPVPAEYGGGTFKDGTNQINNTTLKLTNINPDTGETYDYNLWPSTLNHNPDPVTKSWREATGVMTAKDYFVKNNMIEVSKPFFTTETPVTVPAQLQQKIDGIGKIIKEYSWKMVFAKNDAEFNKLQEEMITKSKGLGYDEAVAYEVGNAEKMVFPFR
ncbi:putative aldouronate transport system substrate-binding protein [Paenibacillus algorifonticola]|uniref:Putative aldouronate transport system substrate-binding protein n=1 Tax=Paenibacillus algorifonticola TaxID=684063 RepID=A0A1I2FTJ5_9BACL|nr:extracellular solute-binding protein [Paenibacillus algorifonticola]SFF08734.1 putative aldouronate transport system substrate-binding protein [Paenibacillus algorifonticola]